MRRLSGHAGLKLAFFILTTCGTGVVVDNAYAAGPPIPFDGFTVTNGVISATCPSGAVCTDGVSDNGMLQRYVEVLTGSNAGSYIQFILTEPGVTGFAGADPFTGARGNLLFTNEDFVAQGNRSDGISSRQRMIDSTFFDPTTEQRFVNELTYNFGWAQNATNPFIDSFQRVSVVDYSGTSPVETYYTEADLASNGSGSNFNTFTDLVLKQGIDLDGPSGLTGIQKTQIDIKRGFANTAPCNFPSIIDCTITLPEGSLTYSQAESITAFWVGQILDTGASSDLTFGHTRFENLNNLTDISQNSLTDPEAAGDWPGSPSTTGATLPLPGAYAFNPVDPLSTGMQTVTPSAVIAPPSSILPTVSAGTASSDTTVVAIPMPFNGWTVSGGVFALDPCPVDACGDPIINEGGLYQRIVTIGGEDYVQTIVTDTNATGDPTAPDFDSNSLAFKNESLVKMDEFLQGVISQLHIAERNLDYQGVNPGTATPLSSRTPLPSDGGQFVYDTLIKTGWAHGGPRDPILDASQTILVEDPNFLQTTPFYESFDIKRGETDADKEMNMLAVVGTNSGSFSDPIMFATSIISGAFQNTTHTVLDSPVLPSNGGNIAWLPGDALQVTWVGGNYPTPNPLGRSVVDTTSYTNLSTGDRAESTLTNADDGVSGLYDPDPDPWIVPPYPVGSTPNYTDPFVVP